MNRGSTTGIPGDCYLQEGFNEAPIHESGKSRDVAIQKRLNRRASMRPRFMNRGSVRHR